VTLTLPNGPKSEVRLLQSTTQWSGDVGIIDSPSWLKVRRDGLMVAGAQHADTIVWDVSNARLRPVTSPALTDADSLNWSRSGVIAWGDYQPGFRAWDDTAGEPLELPKDITSTTVAFDRVVLITATILVLTAVNVIGVRDSARFSFALAVWKLLSLLLLVAIAIPLLDFSHLPAGAHSGVRGFWTSMLLLTYAFSGFESIGIPAGESHNPTRDVPFALFTTLAVITILYTVIHPVCIGTVADLAESTRPLADVGTRVAGAPLETSNAMTASDRVATTASAGTRKRGAS
jgi:amino acid transporter